MSDAPALITFSEGWVNSNTMSPDGFPVYEEIVTIVVERPPLLKTPPRRAMPEDFRDHKAEYEDFLLNQKSKKNTQEEGYPLVYWPAATAAAIQMLAVRNVTTVEGLAKLAGSRDLPGPLADLALRAERMLDLQSNFGKYEAMLHDKDGQLEVLNEQVKDLRQSLSAANAIIETLKLKAA